MAQRYSLAIPLQMSRLGRQQPYLHPPRKIRPSQAFHRKVAKLISQLHPVAQKTSCRSNNHTRISTSYGGVGTDTHTITEISSSSCKNRTKYGNGSSTGNNSIVFNLIRKKYSKTTESYHPFNFPEKMDKTALFLRLSHFDGNLSFNIFSFVISSSCITQSM